MEREPTTYQAFVSYRHAEVDSAVARDVQRGLERFRVPAPMRGELGLKRIAPVFRDKEELAVSPTLGEEIEAALERSSALVVVCSPRTKESQWVDREIEAYLRTHDRSRVFTVLAEGEPFEVIPERLLFEEVDGERRALEPLSCDFRSSKRGDRRVELVRLAAAVLGVGFDSLMQRDRRRRARVAAVAAVVAFALVASVAGYALWSNARISESYEQSVLRRAQLLATQAEQQIDAGDRLAAIELASEAVPARGEGRPVLPQAMRALARATCAYETGYVGNFSPSARLVAKYDVGGQVAAAGVSPNQRYLATATRGGDIRVWDVASAEMLFQTRFGDGYYSDIVATDDGCVIASNSYDTVTCWDAHSQQQKWTCGKPEQSDVSGVLGPYYERFYLDDTGESLIALGEREAHKLDVATGTIVASCDYELGEDEYISRFGGNGNDIAFDRNDNQAVACLQISKHGEESRNDCLCRIDFASGEARMLPSRFGWVHSIQLVDDNDALVSYSDEDNYYLEGNYMLGAYLLGQSSYARHVERIDLSSGESRWKADVPLWAASLSDSLQVLQDFEAPFVSEFVSGDDARRVVAYCTSNVCEVLNLDTGASLAHYEASAPIVVSWAHAKDDKTSNVRGVLAEGRDVAFFSNGNCSSRVDQFVSASFGWRLKNATLLVSEDKDMLYLYVDSLADEPLATLQGAGGSSINTKRGVVCVRCSYTEGKEQTMTIRLLDCEKRCTAWEQSIKASKEATLKVVGYSEEHEELYVTKEERTDGSAKKACTVYTIGLENGEIQQWDACTDSREWNGTDPNIDSYSSYASGVGADFGEDNKIIVTDLHERTSEVVPAVALGIDPEKYYGLDKIMVSPDKGMLVVPGEQSESDEEAIGYSLYRPKDGFVKKLSVPLAKDRADYITWSSDQTRFAALGVDSLVAYDASGNELLNVPLAGRTVLALHFTSNKLLAVCNEGPATVLLSYALDGSAAEQRIGLVNGESVSSTSPIQSVQWVDASQGRDLARDPGDLCVVIPHTGLVLLDATSLEACQEIGGCLGYDQRSGIFVVQEGSSEYNVYLYERRTADELVERGRAQVGNSAMGSEKRLEFGLQ